MNGELGDARNRSIPRVGTTQWHMEVSRARKQGVDVLPLSGVTSGPIPEGLKRAAQKAIDGPMTSEFQGLQSLRQRISRKVTLENRIPGISDQEVLLTYGARQALQLALLALIRAGDEVIVFSPCYPYEYNIRIAGGIPVYLDAKPEQGYSFPVIQLGAAITKKSRVVLLNNPANPTGHAATAEELESIMDIAQHHNLFVISDESFEKLVFARPHRSIASFPEAGERVVTVFSLSKGYGLGAWRVGYMVGPRSAIRRAANFLEWTTLAHHPVSQVVANWVLTNGDSWVMRVRRAFSENRTRVCDGLRKFGNVMFTEPDGTGSVFMDLRAYESDDAALARRLIWDYGLPVTPGRVFRSPGYVRMPFGGSPEVLTEALVRLSRALSHKAL